MSRLAALLPGSATGLAQRPIGIGDRNDADLLVMIPFRTSTIQWIHHGGWWLGHGLRGLDAQQQEIEAESAVQPQLGGTTEKIIRRTAHILVDQAGALGFGNDCGAQVVPNGDIRGGMRGIGHLPNGGEKQFRE